MAIDNPLEKIQAILDEKDDPIFGKLVAASALFNPAMKVVAMAKSLIDAGNASDRLKAAIRALCGELQRLDKNMPSNPDQALEQDWFARGVKILIEEAERSTTVERAMLLAKALAHGCFPSDEDKHRQQDVASYIHDLARLGSDDVQMLRLLCEAHGDAIKTTPNMHDPNYFTANFEKFKKLESEQRIHPDDTVSLCARLSGFGLAYEVPRNTNKQAVGEHCFRPTRRGVYVLSLLNAAERDRPGV